MALNPGESDRRTIHDRITETIVVVETAKKKKGEGTGS